MNSCWAQKDAKILVFSKTVDFRHKSIPIGVETIKQLGKEHNFLVDATEDDEVLVNTITQYDAVVFLNTTGNILNKDQQKVFESYIQNGGGYVGIHSATDTEYEWPWYGKMVGGCRCAPSADGGHRYAGGRDLRRAGDQRFRDRHEPQQCAGCRQHGAVAGHVPGRSRGGIGTRSVARCQRRYGDAGSGARRRQHLCGIPRSRRWSCRRSGHLQGRERAWSGVFHRGHRCADGAFGAGVGHRDVVFAVA